MRPKKAKVCPIILAAGPAPRLPFPKPLAPFAGKTALAIAVDNCRDLAPAIVVLGCQAARVRSAVPRGAGVVVNRRWRSGQMSSLRAGLRRVPREAAFLLYPVDLPLLTPAIIRRLVRAFHQRGEQQAIVAPFFRGRTGHPVVLAPSLRRELARARTAKEVIERNERRVMTVGVRTPAIWQDFNTLTAYRKSLRRFRRRR